MVPGDGSSVPWLGETLAAGCSDWDVAAAGVLPGYSEASVWLEAASLLESTLVWRAVTGHSGPSSTGRLHILL